MAEAAYPRFIPIDSDGYQLPDRSVLVGDSQFPVYIPVDADGTFLADGSTLPDELPYPRFIPVDGDGVVQGGSNATVEESQYPRLIPVDESGLLIGTSDSVGLTRYALYIPVDVDGVTLSTAGGASFNPPTDLIITTDGTTDDRTIQLDWSAPATGTPNDYTVQLSTDGVVWTDDQTSSHPTITASYTGLLDGTYYVRVRANYESGSSTWLTSNSIIFITGSKLLPHIVWGFF